MSMSIAQSRQHMAELIEAAQHAPQVITKRNAPVAVLVSTDYFKRSEAAVKTAAPGFYSQLVKLRLRLPPDDDSGIGLPKAGRARRDVAWKRSNAFAAAK